MFPNVRLLAGALIASIVALSCGFGLFAAFRVNHEPLSRLRVGNSPVQLVANEVAAPRAGWGTPFDGQSLLNGPSRGASADATVAAPTGQISFEATHAGAAEAIKPVAVAIPVIETASPRELAQPAEVIEPVVSITPAAAVPVSPAPEAAKQTSRPAPAAAGPAEQSTPAAVTTAVVPANSMASPIGVAPDVTASVPSPPAKSARPASVASLPEVGSAPHAGATASAAAAPEQAGSAAISPAANAVLAPQAPAPVIATATPPDQSSVVAPLAHQAEPAPETAKSVGKIAAKKDGKIIRRPAARRRIAVRRRIVRWRRTIGQDSFNNPIFRTAPNYQRASTERNSAFGW